MSDPRPTPEEIQAKWKETWSKEYADTATTHKAREFTFNPSEMPQVIRLATVGEMARRSLQLSEDAIQALLNNYVLPRVGVVPSDEVKVIFSLAAGRFVVFEPRESSQPKKPKKEPS